MGKERSRARWLLAAIPLAATQAMAVQLSANWGPAASGSYATASNWDIGQVPLNNAGSSYIVSIGSNRTVAYGVPGAQQIDQLLLDLGSRFNLSSSSLISPSRLTVLGPALIAGSISADNASFSALASGTAFLGSAVSLSATAGGALRIGATSLNATGLPANAVILNANGAGSLIELQQLQSLNAGQSTGYSSYVNATAGGRLDLSGLTTLTAPASSNGSALVFTLSGGGDVNLSALRTVGGATAEAGYTSFSLDASTATLGALQKANRLSVGLQNGSTMTLASGAGGAEITSSSFSVTGGSTLDGSALAGTLVERSIGANATILSATGSGSVLRLKGLRTLDAGQGTGYNTYVNVGSGARMDLSGLTSIVAPATGNGAALVFTVNGGADLDLSSLQAIGGVTIDSGYTSFSVDAASVRIGPLQKANRLSIGLANGATLAIGGGAGSADISNSSFAVASGAVLDGSTLAGSFNARGTGANATLLSATGAGSVLNLSAIRSLDAGQGTGYNSFVSATAGGRVDLSGLTTLVAPATANGAALVFSVNGGGRLDLQALQVLGGVTAESGYTSFSVDGASAVLGPLQRANRLSISLSNGAAMTVGGYAGTAELSSASFSVAGGSVLDASRLVGTLDERATGANATLISVAGAGSLLNLSGLRSLDAGQATGYGSFVNAGTGGRLDLSGLNSVVAPTANGALLFQASGGGSIDLSQLQTLTNPAGHLHFNASTGGSLQLHGLNAGNGVHFNLADAGSRITVQGSLNLRSGSTMAAGAGTLLQVRGDYAFAHTVESQMNLDFATLRLDGGSEQRLEVGGRLLGTLPAGGAAVTGNFAIGELDVGGGALASTVFLQDAIDNGNRTGGSEVLYLNGAGGGNGLRILGGSTLVLGGLDLWAVSGGSWVHINELFTNGTTRIAYDEGFIVTVPQAVPEPAQWAMLAAGLALLGRRRMRAAQR